MSKIRRFLVTVDTELCGTSEEYYAEANEDLEKNVSFLNICDELAYDNYKSYDYHYDYKYRDYDIESDEYHEIESEKYYFLVSEISDEEYEESKEYYNGLERIW